MCCDGIVIKDAIIWDCAEWTELGLNTDPVENRFYIFLSHKINIFS